MIGRGALILAALMAAVAPALAGEEFDCLIEPHAIVRVGSATDGLLAEVLADRGDFVKRGQVLARLDSRVEKAVVALARARSGNRVDVRSAEAALEFEIGKLKRNQRLLERQVVSSAAYDESRRDTELADLARERAEMDRTVAALEVKRAEALLARREITSPIDGVVVERNLSPGEYVYDQAQILTVAQLDPLDVEVFVPVEMYPQLHPGGMGTVQPLGLGGGAHEAEIKVVDRVFDAASGTVGVRLEFPNPGAVLPAGVRCTVRFHAD